MDTLSCVLILLLTCVVTQAFLSIVVGRNKAKYKLPPGPFPLPIIGNLLALGNKPHQSLTKLAKIHGPILALKLGQVTTIIVSSAELAKQVLQTHDSSLSDRTVPQALSALNHDQFGVGFLCVTPLWRDMRRICKNQLFSNKTLDASQYLRRKKIEDLLSDVNQSCISGEAVNIGGAAFKTSLNSLTNTIFSIDFIQNSSDTGEYKDIVMGILKAVGTPNMADFFPLLKTIDPQGIKKSYACYIGKLFHVFDNLIHQRLKLREGTNYVTNNDMLDALLDISEDNSKEMDNEKIKHLLHDLLVGGTDTTAYALEWAMAEVLHNPNAMSKAKKELEETVGIGKPIEESDIVRLPYLQAIIKETLRLHPIAPLLLPRKARTDVELNGYIIPKGAQILVNEWAIGRDPESWDNPNLFSPERFLGSKVDIQGKNFELTPFGSGRRICPGMPLAIRMLHLMLGSLINSFNWKLENGMKSEEMDMEEAIQGLAIRKSETLRVVPIKISI
ncbi:geraniol 8-hydroxylase-like [Gastrolobium bilobum]|uniref:geraniol 8-hydroxylase-like n=1 Tax=Gastrolobium bilobum TaxID=150636 RepID=UPI002AB14645|nr:geraniol 8-hydroxylase-like [Gastrolobium bilobum]